jgi:hypothetical protein
MLTLADQRFRILKGRMQVACDYKLVYQTPRLPNFSR